MAGVPALVLLLRARGNDVLVVLGPFNEHMIDPDQRPTFVAMRAQVDAWLTQNRFTTIAPEALPSELYADASHPLTDGYACFWQERLARIPTSVTGSRRRIQRELEVSCRYCRVADSRRPGGSDGRTISPRSKTIPLAHLGRPSFTASADSWPSEVGGSSRCTIAGSER